MPWINLIIWCVVKKFSWYKTDNSPSLLPHLVWFFVFVFVFLISENNSHLVKGDIFVFLISQPKRGLERLFPFFSSTAETCTPKEVSFFVIFMGVMGKIHMAMFILLMIWFLSWLSRVFLFVLKKIKKNTAFQLSFPTNFWSLDCDLQSLCWYSAHKIH